MGFSSEGPNFNKSVDRALYLHLVICNRLYFLNDCLESLSRPHGAIAFPRWLTQGTFISESLIKELTKYNPMCL